MKKVPKKDVEQFWKKKEEDIGEKIKGKSMAEFIGGYQNFSGPILGILFYTESAFYFQAFPRRNWLFSFMRAEQPEREENQLNFRILWSDVEKIELPPRKHPFLALLSPQNYRIFIDYQSNGQKMTLTLTMHCLEDRSRLIDFYKYCKTKKEW
ncbi:MAG: hypothetical protein KAX30_08295 [Candidatus Atribacteria bacterium]|nr:hypothetical protein [Candidatus Atribacteria bacterium]